MQGPTAPSGVSLELYGVALRAPGPRGRPTSTCVVMGHVTQRRGSWTVPHSGLTQSSQWFNFRPRRVHALRALDCSSEARVPVTEIRPPRCCLGRRLTGRVTAVYFQGGRAEGAGYVAGQYRAAAAVARHADAIDDVEKMKGLPHIAFAGGSKQVTAAGAVRALLDDRLGAWQLQGLRRAARQHVTPCKAESGQQTTRGGHPALAYRWPIGLINHVRPGKRRSRRAEVSRMAWSVRRHVQTNRPRTGSDPMMDTTYETRWGING
ncbi:hypothetical protein BS50DRAFT_350740 [Corynespora cassiicola Philippines]|uniref:Uncharacterized protein n=1 Tax=Corynespora cassiicola Philippines TaxID=1448308 RepID=A0A2T2NRZ1_CORCC|nr:hypothetical protein BS50DRAFT_350740 [Corynespora cassiicola Philippines]